MAVSTTVPETAPASAALDLTIAGTRLRFLAPPGATLGAPGWEYPPFLADVPHDLNLSVPVHLRTDLVPPATPACFRTGDAWSLHRDADGTWRFVMQDPRSGRGLWHLVTRAPFDAWSLEVSETGAADPLLHLVQYPLDQLLLTHALYPRGGLLLHAAGLRLGDRALVFAGVSGAGKSTLCRLLRRDPRFQGLSDDRVFLRPDGHGMTVHGTPWAGDAGVATPGHAPLAAVCFIERADRVRLSPLESGEALARLLPTATLPWYDVGLLDRALAGVEGVLAQAPSYVLGVPLDADALGGTLHGAFAARV